MWLTCKIMSLNVQVKDFYRKCLKFGGKQCKNYCRSGGKSRKWRVRERTSMSSSMQMCWWYRRLQGKRINASSRSYAGSHYRNVGIIVWKHAMYMVTFPFSFLTDDWNRIKSQTFQIKRSPFIKDYEECKCCVFLVAWQ